MKTITLHLDFFTARLVRDSLLSRSRFYGVTTVGYEHCVALAQFLDEELRSPAAADRAEEVHSGVC